MNYRERIVYSDLKSLGYEVSLCEEKGYPDFRGFSFKTGEKLYVEVKNNLTGQIQYSGDQYEVFELLVKEGNLVLIAIPERGLLEYKVFPGMALWRKVPYGTASLEIPLLKCKRCGAEWEGRVKEPVQCPRCKSLRWKE